MLTGREARDRDDMVPIGGEGGRSSFDGNYPPVSWLIGLNIKTYGLNADDMGILMSWVERGHLAWVVIPND